MTAEDIKLTENKVHSPLLIFALINHFYFPFEMQLVFSGSSKGGVYTVDLEFINEVDPTTSTWKVHQRNVQMHIMKKDSKVHLLSSIIIFACLPEHSI